MNVPVLDSFSLWIVSIEKEQLDFRISSHGFFSAPAVRYKTHKQLKRYNTCWWKLMIVHLCNSLSRFGASCISYIVLYKCFFLFFEAGYALAYPTWHESHFMEELVSVFLISYVGSPVLWSFKNPPTSEPNGPQLSNLTSWKPSGWYIKTLSTFCCI